MDVSMDSTVQANQDERSSERDRLLVRQPSPRSSITSDQVNQLTNLLLKIDRRLDSVETRLRNLESLKVPQCDHAAGGFPKFRLLPIELRLRIWDFAIPRRILRHSYTPPGDDPEPQFTYGLAPPVISRVCQESRSVARRRGDIFQLMRRALHKEEMEYYWTWFDGSHDILELRAPAYWEYDIEAGGCLEVMIRAECILVSMSDVAGWFDSLFNHKEVRQTLRTINIQRVDPELVGKNMWNPRVVVDLFGHDSVVLVDVEDLDQVNRVCQALVPLERSLTSAVCGAKFYLNGWQVRWGEVKSGNGIKLRSGSMRKAVKVVRKAWLLRNEVYPWGQDYRPSSTLPYPDAHDERKLIVGMPQIRIAYAMYLGRGPSDSGQENDHPELDHAWDLSESEDDD